MLYKQKYLETLEERIEYTDKLRIQEQKANCLENDVFLLRRELLSLRSICFNSNAPSEILPPSPKLSQFAPVTTSKFLPTSSPSRASAHSEFIPWPLLVKNIFPQFITQDALVLVNNHVQHFFSSPNTPQSNSMTNHENDVYNAPLNGTNNNNNAILGNDSPISLPYNGTLVFAIPIAKKDDFLLWISTYSLPAAEKFSKHVYTAWTDVVRSKYPNFKRAMPLMSRSAKKFTSRKRKGVSLFPVHSKRTGKTTLGIHDEVCDEFIAYMEAKFLKDGVFGAAVPVVKQDNEEDDEFGKRNGQPAVVLSRTRGHNESRWVDFLTGDQQNVLERIKREGNIQKVYGSIRGYLLRLGASVSPKFNEEVRVDEQFRVKFQTWFEKNYMKNDE